MALALLLALLAAAPGGGADAGAGLPAIADAGAGATAEDAGAPPEDAGAAAPKGVLVAPSPLEQPVIAPPTGVEIKAPVEVDVDLTVSEKGGATDVEVTKSGGAAFDAAVVEGVKKFRFQPATLDGKPIPVRISFQQRFEPPPPLVAAAPDLDAEIEGLVITRGTRKPVKGAAVVAKDEKGRQLGATTDDTGAFKLAVPSNEALDLRIVAQDYEKFVQREKLAPNQHLQVKYLVNKKSLGQFEATVEGERERTEVSRTTLSGRELTRVPGTFGDPFRVVNMLPGVTSVMSLLPLPVVRGSSPGDTGFLLDGIRLPLLFHLFGGPSVIHPEFVDRVDFYPGGFPVKYGGYTGGIVDGVTRAARPDEHRIDLDLNLAQTGVLVREPVPVIGSTVSVAGRVGYPGLLLSLLVPTLSLNYWDYQARVDRGGPRSRWTAFFYGASDVVKIAPAAGQPLKTVAQFTFHRADLRYAHGDEAANEVARLVFGYDDSVVGGTSQSEVSASQSLGNGTWSIEPRVEVHRSPFPRLQLDLGADVTGKNISNPPASTSGTTSANNQAAQQIVNQSGYFVTSSAWVQGVWHPVPRLSIIPGLRADRYDERGSQNVSQWDLDPRLLARWRLTDAELGGTTLKGVVGRYHQPPRLFVPVPGLDESSLNLGLLASNQYSVGAETKLGPASDVDVNVYYNDMNPVVFDLSVNPSAADVQQAPPDYPPWQAPPPGSTKLNPTLASLFTKRQGRSYGLEILLRRHDAERLFGWVSYTLSRSERKTATGWQLFDFDRLHILNFVAGVRLPRNWELGARMLMQSGTPLTTIFGTNDTRSDAQFRLDLRIDKRAVWNTWLLDFYVDVINTTVSAESGGLIGGSAVRYVVPTIGVRGVL